MILRLSSPEDYRQKEVDFIWFSFFNVSLWSVCFRDCDVRYLFHWENLSSPH